MAFLNLLSPAPHIEPLTDPKEIDTRYRYWRWRIFFGIYVGYVLYYFSRKSVIFALPMLLEAGYTKSDVGLLGSILSITYGMSKFFGGVLGDRSNPRYFMAIGLMLTGLMNVFFGFSSIMLFFGLFTAVNGWFQGWGSPSSVRQVTHWFSQKERGLFWGIWTTAQNVGISIIVVFTALLAEYHFGWRVALWIPGLFSICGGFLIIYFLRDTPQSVGLPPIEVFKNDYPIGKVSEEKTLSVREILFQYVLNNPYIWLLGVAYFFIYIAREAMTNWGLLYLIEVKHYSQMLSSYCIVAFEIGGFIGCVVAGWISDRIFGGLRGPIGALCSLLLTFLLIALWTVRVPNVWLDATLFLLIGVVIYGSHMTIGIHAMEMVHKKAAGSANGFISWIAYLGAATASYPLGVICEIYSWGVFLAVLVVSSAISFGILAPLWSVRRHPKHVEPTPN